jgi:uncharacterized protein YfdQ (DUF2303 family)
MQKDALDFIERQSLQAASVEGVDVPSRVLHKDFQIVSLEKQMKNRARYRGKFNTKAISDFAIYSSQFPRGKCFVNADHMKAVSIFDLGTVDAPLHAEHSATITLQQTAPYKAMLATCNDRLERKRLAEWLEDWADYLIGYTAAGEAMDIKLVISTVRKLTIASAAESTHTTNDFNASRSSLETIEAKSGNVMAAGVRFKCTPYHGLGERSFDLRLSIITDHDDPKLILRVVRLEDAVEQMAKEFAEVLNTALKSGGADADIVLGTFDPS